MLESIRGTGSPGSNRSPVVSIPTGGLVPFRIEGAKMEILICPIPNDCYQELKRLAEDCGLPLRIVLVTLIRMGIEETEKPICTGCDPSMTAPGILNFKR